MLIKAEITVILPQALGAIRSKQEPFGGGGVVVGGSVALPTSRVQASGLCKCETVNFGCFKPPVHAVLL